MVVMQMDLLCRTLQIEPDLLNVQQVATSFDQATFAVGQLMARRWPSPRRTVESTDPH